MRGLSLLAVLLLALTARPALADDDAGRSWVQRWFDQPTLTGDWFGFRDRLAVWGITPTASYATDLLANPVGGLRRGAAYAGDLNVTVDVDLAKLAGIPGLSGQVAGSWSTGTDLSQDIGNFFQVAQYFEGDQLRLYTLFLRQTLLEGRLDLKAGRFATGDDFLASPIGVSLVNEALNPVIFAVQANVPGVTAYPNATWGGRVFAQPIEPVTLAAGAFYSDPFLDQRTASGTEFGIDSRAGYFAIGEATFRVGAGEGARMLPGRYRLGGYYDSNLYAPVADPGGPQTRGNYGFFFMGEQMLAREGGRETDEGLTLFWAFVYAPVQRINPLPYFAATGLSYRGLLPTRRADTAALAVYYGGFSRDLPGQTYEVVLEATYAIAVTPWLTVLPDMQYVINPGGRSSTSNALVVGVQIAVQF
jgi:porin